MIQRARKSGLPAIAALALTLASASLAHAAAIVQLGVVLRDESGAPASGRVLVLDEHGASFVPPAAVTENIGLDTWFACDGRTRLDVPAGHYQIRVEHGPEFTPVKEEVVADKNTSREFRLHRWINLRERGYSTGENHLHVPVDPLPVLMRAEGLDFGTSLEWWNGPYFAVPGASSSSAAAAASKTITPFDSEVENDWGALYSIGLRAPMPVAWNPARANVAFAAAARAAGALNCYQGGWSREALVDALLGYVDVINVGDNLFHRYKFMPRSRNGNLLEAPGLPVYPDTEDGMLRLATESYYRLLNCGLHLAAGAGSATGVKSSPAGYNRAYVKVAAGAPVRDFLERWRTGHNFVTNGPMLFLTVNGTREPGDTLDLPPGGGDVTLHAEALSGQPLRSVTLVVNGETVAHSEGSVVEKNLHLANGAWIAAVATAEDRFLTDPELARYRQDSRLGGEMPGRLLFAHTSPVYVNVGGKGARVPASVAEAQRLLDAFETFARKTAAPEFQTEILRAVATARERLGSGT